MEIRLSLQDDLFNAAEAMAARLGCSRDELYQRAIADFVSRLDEEGIRQRLDDIYADLPSAMDPILDRMQRKSLPKDGW